MPQASPKLRAKFPGGDREAWAVLIPNFGHRLFVIYPKVSTHKITKREGDAIDYLFHEWDYMYDPEGGGGW